MRFRAAALLCVPVLCALGACQPASGEAPALVEMRPLSFAPLVRKVVPAVVNIAVMVEGSNQVPEELRGTPFERQFRDRMRGRRERVTGAGSGFIIDPAGVIVTNDHVVGEADRIVVSLADGTELPARVVGVDDLTDIAVIRVQADHPLPYVSWGDSRQVQVGDWIMAAGNPFGLSSSVTAGIVSARGREIGAGPFDDFFQLDAPINPGNSGGPAFNMAGEVIGVNTAIVSPTGGSVGIGFAIPSEIAQGVVESLVRKGRIDRGWLGVKLQESPGRPGGGVVIVSVDRGSPAAHSTLRAGDLVTAVNGTHVETTHDLVRLVAAADPGSRAVLTVQRQRHAMEVPVTVGKRPADAADVPE